MGNHARAGGVSGFLVAGIAVWAALTGAAMADCGSIPFTAVLDARNTVILDLLDPDMPDVKVDPLNVVVYEPGQRAIVLWNGEEEILLLSTEIRTSQPVSILEVIPLPAEPTVELGDFESFQKMQQLVVDKTMWKVASGGGVPGQRAPADAARITFHERMGAHDLSVVQVLDRDHFVDWVKAFLAKRGANQADVRPEFVEVIDNYLTRNFDWFVFDVIETGDTLRTRQPVQYRFRTDSLYYPLEISSLETGKTSIDLLLVTGNKLESYGVVQASVKRYPHFTATLDEIHEVSPQWAKMMDVPVLTLQQVRIRGKLGKMKSDFLAR